MKRLFGILLVNFFMIFISMFSATADSPLVKPHTFTPGTTAKSSEVNANFDLLYERVNQLNRIVVKNNGLIIGTLLSIYGGQIDFITSSGYIVTINFNETSGNYEIMRGNLYFESSDCSGTAYTSNEYFKHVFRAGNQNLYRIDAWTVPISYTSTLNAFNGTCSTNSPSSVKHFPAILNNESVTCVPDNGYSGPITIEIE